MKVMYDNHDIVKDVVYLKGKEDVKKEEVPIVKPNEKPVVRTTTNFKG